MTFVVGAAETDQMKQIPSTHFVFLGDVRDSASGSLVCRLAVLPFVSNEYIVDFLFFPPKITYCDIGNELINSIFKNNWYIRRGIFNILFTN